ncbi:MAG: UDP-N-acetylglucosamine 2-epimerase (non-hydrolyzing) [Chromatiaceae bacterium]|nr:UDP-N-acetylglucosamine 2-epimerase (non-hydrolyzing) [Chromatiaceae bacterium]MCP5437818.1 UDP-N-acetylglucosamine 2-epimerase (non-hydrolyzing) [Chromatiaceae bacterium]MCP5439491.1 UDP-N-acetylglucosamine 2-epimerase (non-hydrolyzing) [Chromatiaceae bacterium]HPE80213.1 UDP-N-acetylglucosamine 2-epimerase (non-hydrolyzing) [Gammaproteobacteria bacterium]
MTRSDPPLRLLCIVGARPNFMKIAPLMRVFRARPDRFDARLVHTGQHYDEAMKDAFFRQLHIPEPDIDLGVGSGSHAVQTAEIMRRFEPVLDDLQPDVVLVVGDVNSTIACALVATKKGIAVVHVEAGLRSGDRGMPEEINRVLTDQISDLLFTTEADGATNLMREGIAADRIHFVGNVMIDTLLANRERAIPAEETLGGIAGFAGDPAGFGVLTLHRPSNVDDPVVLRRLLEVLVQLSERLPLVFPIHPRTRGRIADAGLSPVLAASRIALTDPLGYLQLLGLMAKARIVLTDSGGLQEETTALGIPCVTLRENTERPITVEQGTNTIVGTDPAKIKDCFDEVMASGGKSGRVPELWDGQAAERIADTLLAWAGSRAEAA